MESLISKCTKIYCRFSKKNALWQATGFALEKEILNDQKTDLLIPPLSTRISYKVKKEHRYGLDYYILSPKKGAPQQTIFYFHGGGYILNAKKYHWKFIEKMISHTGATVIFPLYPLAPSNQYLSIFDGLSRLYNYFLQKEPSMNYSFVGDSAGGGLALGLAELFVEKKLAQPKELILISPLLDLTMTNPEIKRKVPVDPILSPEAFFCIAKWYAGESSLYNYLISPIYGCWEKVAPIYLFSGTADILFPDAVRLKQAANQKNRPLSFYPYQNMVHIWPLLYSRESKQARKTIFSILNQSN